MEFKLTKSEAILLEYVLNHVLANDLFPSNVTNDGKMAIAKIEARLTLDAGDAMGGIMATHKDDRAAILKERPLHWPCIKETLKHLHKQKE